MKSEKQIRAKIEEFVNDANQLVGEGEMGSSDWCTIIDRISLLNWVLEDGRKGK